MRSLLRCDPIGSQTHQQGEETAETRAFRPDFLAAALARANTREWDALDYYALPARLRGISNDCPLQGQVTHVKTEP